MAFKISDMRDVGTSYKEPQVRPSKKKVYPNLHLNAKKLKELARMKFGQKVTVHAHGTVTGKQQYDDNPPEFSIELEKIGIKSGHNPVKEYISKYWTSRLRKALKRRRARG